MPFWRYGLAPPPRTSPRVFVSWVPVRRPANWLATYVSLGMGTTPPHHWDATVPALTNPPYDPYARTNPFNPCKPLWSSICQNHPDFGYYGPNEDWAAPTAAQIIAAGGSAPGTLP